MTILFQSDWMKHPGAVIHYETKNTSFLRLAEIYYQMGVKNNAFHLSLLDASLKEVDPFDPNLTLEVKARIVRECKNNFWYFLREVLRIPVPGSMNPTVFAANRANIGLYWLFFNHVMTVVVIIRQTGKTTLLMALVTYLLNMGSTNTFINLLTKNESLKAETLAKVKALFEELPEYINFSTKKDIFNSDEVNLRDLSNKFKGNLSSSSPKQAEKVGRGFTAPINIIDEGAFIENIAVAMGAMLMSGNAARTAAAANGKHYGTVIATTAGDIDDRDGNYIFRLCTSATTWDERFMDAEDEKELNELILTNSNAAKNEARRPMVHLSLSYRQLGYDDAWLQQKIAENISTPENLRRDLFNEWLSGSSKSPIPKEYITLLRDNVNQSPRSDFFSPYNYLLRWYITEEETERRMVVGHNFIVGIDTSDGAGRDDISFVVRDHTNGEIICVAVFNEINLITLADFFVSFLLRYVNSVMIIERRSSAAAIIDYMMHKLSLHDINPFDRLYNHIYQNKEGFATDYEILKRARPHQEEIFTKYKKYIGFTTSGSGVTSRSELYSGTLMSMLKYTSTTTYDDKLITQIVSLVIKNNRIDHPDGGNDDLVIGALLSYWLLITGKNLSAYGIDTSTLMRSNKTYLEEKYKDVDDLFDEEEVYHLERELNELLENYKSENNPHIAAQLELRIKKLGNELNIYNNVISAEELIENVKRERKLRQTRT